MSVFALHFQFGPWRLRRFRISSPGRYAIRHSPLSVDTTLVSVSLRHLSCYDVAWAGNALNWKDGASG
jgi:hypothetical protein